MPFLTPHPQHCPAWHLRVSGPWEGEGGTGLSLCPPRCNPSCQLVRRAIRRSLQLIQQTFLKASHQYILARERSRHCSRPC